MARRGGRQQRLMERTSGPKEVLRPQTKRATPPVDLLSAADIDRIHDASLAILARTGVHFMGEGARNFLARHPGIQVDQMSEFVRFDETIVENALSQLPSQFTLHARNPRRSMVLGGDNITFANVVTPPFVDDRDAGVRDGSFDEMKRLLKLYQMLPALDMCLGYPVEPLDLSPETRHLDGYAAHAVLTDKPWRAYTLGDDRMFDALEIARIARGIDAKTMEREPSLLANVTTNSPLRIDEPMGEGLMTMAKRMQPVSITSFAMIGAIAPITLAGAIAQQNAEILAAIVLSQLSRPGTPLLYGSFSTNVHMKSGAIAFGNPELAQAMLISGQLARRYGMPFKAAMGTGAKVVDVQAGYESQYLLSAAVMAGGHLCAHSIGFMESALTVNREKIIADSEMVELMRGMVAKVEVSNDTLALESIHEVGPGGNFFETQHTIDRYETAFWQPRLADWENRQNWIEKGGERADERATKIWKELEASYLAPAIDAATRDELDDYVTRRKIEIDAACAA